MAVPRTTREQPGRGETSMLPSAWIALCLVMALLALGADAALARAGPPEPVPPAATRPAAVAD